MKTLKLLPLIFLLSACAGHNDPVSQKDNSADTVFTQSRVRTYARYYNGLDFKVVSLNLFSEGLSPDNDSLHNTGTNLYFSDIFIDTAATAIPAAEYALDSVPALHSALPALYFDGLLTGSCLIRMRDGAVEDLTLFSGGKFSVSYDGDTAVMDFRLETAEKRTYHATYRGIPLYDKN